VRANHRAVETRACPTLEQLTWAFSERSLVGAARMGGMPLALDDDLRALLTRPSPWVITTLLPDGSPHATQVWVDADGDHVLVNSVEGHRKVRNVRSDPRVAVTVLDAEELSRYVSRGDPDEWLPSYSSAPD
jgi:hypothetical protein